LPLKGAGKTRGVNPSDGLGSPLIVSSLEGIQFKAE
jgi:hypothetical protein